MGLFKKATKWAKKTVKNTTRKVGDGAKFFANVSVPGVIKKGLTGRDLVDSSKFKSSLGRKFNDKTSNVRNVTAKLGLSAAALAVGVPLPSTNPPMSNLDYAVQPYDDQDFLEEEDTSDEESLKASLPVPPEILIGVSLFLVVFLFILSFRK